MFQFEIVSPDGIIFSDTVEEVSLPTQKGEISILTHHMPLFSKLIEGEVKIHKNGKTTHFALFGGFLEIKNSIVSVLSDYAVHADTIEIAKSMEAKKRAEDILKSKIENADILIAEKELQKAILELKVADKIRRRHS